MLSSLQARMGKRLGMFVIAMAMHAAAGAGSVEGPYVAWVNLSDNPKLIDTRIRDYVNSDKAEKDCWGHSGLLYMRRKPAGLTKEFVRQAVVDKDPKALRALNKLLKQPFDELDAGMDGVIVYDDANGPRLYSLTTGHKKVDAYKLPDLSHLGKGFCAVLPPITRAP